jgi:molecular chaperone GrpE (heat shock protein)
MAWAMIGWMRKLFSKREQVAPPPAEPALERDAEILEAIQKASRAQARLTARFDAIESKIEGGFMDLRAAIAAAAPARTSMRWDDLLDAMDLLDEAVRLVGTTVGREAADGLQGIGSRLDRFLAQSGLARLGVPERLDDGRRFRVVGTEDLPDRPDGVVVRLVRAAVLDGERVVREGEVTINRRSS